MSFFRWFAIVSSPCRSLESFLQLLVTAHVTWDILYRRKYYDTRSYISAPCYVYSKWSHLLVLDILHYMIYGHTSVQEINYTVSVTSLRENLKT